MSQPRSEPAPSDARESRSADAGRVVALSGGLLLALYLGLTLAYRDSIPLFEAPDEPGHLHYAAFVYSQGRLPYQEPAEVPGVGLQPPLFYLVSAPFLAASGLDVAGALPDLRRAGLATYGQGTEGSPRLALVPRGARHFATDGSLAGLGIVRSTSLAFGLLAVSIAFAAVWRLSHDVRLSLLAGGLLAFNPQVLFTSATFSNDAAALSLGAAALWLVTRVIETPGTEPARRHYLAAAALVLLGLVTKLTALPALCVTAVTIAALDRRPLPERNADVALATGLVLLGGGLYLLDALESRGGLLGADLALATAAGRALPDYVHTHALPYLASVYWDETFESYWARFGWLDLAAPKAVGLAFFALSWTGVLGYFTGRVPDPSAALRSRALRAYLLASVGLTAVAHLAINLAVALPQGRLLLTVAPQIGLLLALGLTRLLGHEGRMMPIVAGVIVTLLVLDLYCLRGVLFAAY